MRLIKFRAKPKDNTKWIYGSFVKTPNSTYIEWYEDSICNRVEVDPSTIRQYTGFKDKNGNEIYEGDIFKLGPIIYKVIWREDYGGFYLKQDSSKISGTTPLGLLIGSLDYKIVGNTFNNTKIKI